MSYSSRLVQAERPRMAWCSRGMQEQGTSLPKCDLTFLHPVEDYVPLCKPVERASNIRKVFLKVSIVAGQAKKLLTSEEDHGQVRRNVQEA